MTDDELLACCDAIDSIQSKQCGDFFAVSVGQPELRVIRMVAAEVRRRIEDERQFREHRQETGEF